MNSLDALAKTGAEARQGTAGDAVAGVEPAYVAAPGSLDEAAAVMRVAAEHDLCVVPRGAGTKLAWGAPPRRCDLVVETHRMGRLLDHAAGDLVVRAEAGLPFARLADALGGKDQRLALDVPVPGSTVGGVIATSPSGPRRLAFGTVRDLLIGITVVRADGVVASSGGRVVKNVAGYDLAKLFTGSYGTLGLIVGAIFRSHPRPPGSSYVTVRVDTASDAAAASSAVTGSQVVPTAVEIDRPRPAVAYTVTVLLEGGQRDLPARTATTCELLGSGAAASEKQPDGFGTYPCEPDGTLVRLAVPVAALPDAVAAVDAAATASGARPAVRGSAGVGVLYVGLDPGTEHPAVVSFLPELRSRLAALDGNAVVLHAPPEVLGATDVWGPVQALELMRRVKDNFDPEHRMAPGRFAGGI